MLASKRTLVAIALCLCGGAVAISAQDATNPVLKRLDDLELLQRRMQQQLDEIKQLLLLAGNARPNLPSLPEGGTISTAGAPALGDPTAPLVIVEYSDFQCPYCGQFTRSSYPEVKRQLVDAGKVQWVFRHFPLEGTHPLALKSAEAAECAGDQGRFWQMHDELFSHQEALMSASLRSYASDIGLELSRFDSCMGGEATARVRAAQNEGRRLGVNSTPTFLVARRQLDGSLQLRRRVTGAIPADRFIELLHDVQ